MEGCREEGNHFILPQVLPKEEKPRRQEGLDGKANGLEHLCLRLKCKYFDCLFSSIHYKLWKNFKW